jgi:hypothetical protein
VVELAADAARRLVLEHGRASLALVGNPVVWWGSSVGLVVVLVSAPLRALTKPAAGDPARAWPPGLWLLVCGWALCYFPLAGVRRVLFLYHYLSALVFAVCAVALWLDHSGWLTRPGDWRVQPRALWFLVAALVGGFALLARSRSRTYTLPPIKRQSSARFPAGAETECAGGQGPSRAWIPVVGPRRRVSA